MDATTISLLFTSVYNNNSSEESDATFYDSGTTTPATVDLNSFKLVQIRLWIRIILLPILIVFGLFGNVMTILIVKRLRESRSTLDNYFLCLAMSDSCFILTGPLPIWVQSVFDFHMRALNAFTCKLNIFIFNATAGISAWLVVALVVQRALSVVWPHRVGVICTVKKTWITILAIVFILSVAYSHLFYGQTKRGNACGFEDDYMSFLLNVWVKLDVFLFSVVPLTCMMISNTVLVVKLRTSVKLAGEQFATSEKQQNERERTVNTVTLTALLVSVSFIVLTLPIAAWNASKYTVIDNTVQSVDQKVFDYFFQAVLYCVFYINFSINFYLYCLTGRRFRDEFRKIVCGLVYRIRCPVTQSND
ncbi:hypothetical protein ACOMHN_001822 [Nucella lapillus]